LPSLSVL